MTNKFLEIYKYLSNNRFLCVYMCRIYNEEVFTRHCFGSFVLGIGVDKMAKLRVHWNVRTPPITTVIVNLHVYQHSTVTYNKSSANCAENPYSGFCIRHPQHVRYSSITDTTGASFSTTFTVFLLPPSPLASMTPRALMPPMTLGKPRFLMGRSNSS